MQEKSLRLEAALAYAKSGLPIFPCEPDTKKPRAGSNGFHDATTDEAQIRAWWAEKDYNIGFSPADVGWGVVDLDGDAGRVAMSALEAENGKLPETFVVSTPRGGLHIYFDTPLPTTAWAPGRKRTLGEHIDTRGIGSYTLLPPSHFIDPETHKDGYYATVKDQDLAAAPDWIVSRTRRPDRQAQGGEAELDQAATLLRARTFLRDLVQRGHVAVEGRGGNNLTYSVACDILDLGISPETALGLLNEGWNQACSPPWQDSELEDLLTNAASYHQNDAGVYAGAPASETFAAALDKLPAELKVERQPYFHPLSVAEQDAGPEDEDIQWQVPDLIPDEATVLLVGAKASFKSFVSHHLGLMLASGHESMGLSVRRPGPFFYAAHEGFLSLKKRRRLAWEIVHQPVKPYPFYLMRGPRLISPEQREGFIKAIKDEIGDERPSGIVIDTLAKSMIGLEENDVKDTGLAIAFFDELRDTFRCPIIVDHHKAKDGRPGGRGSGNIEAGFETVLELNRPDQGRALELKVRYHKDAEEREEPWTFEVKPILHSIILQPTTPKEHAGIVHASDRFDPKKIGAALASLLAYGKEAAVTTEVLAAEVAPITQDMSEEAKQELIKRTAKTLRLLAKPEGRLEAYAENDGRVVLWSLPGGSSDPFPPQ